MPRVRIRGVAFRWDDARPLLEDVDITLEPGLWGLVGANGAGKTTLLKLLAGELQPSQGAVEREPDDLLVASCPQQVHALDAWTRAFAAAWEKRHVRLKARLKLDPAQHERWATLSPGERKRWQIGSALARDPDLLLLDEPTNHLDADGRDWLIAALHRFRGIAVIVSHDRALLDAVTDHTLRVADASARAWSGAYSRASEDWQAERDQAVHARQAAQDAARLLDRRLADERRTRVAAEQQRSVRTRARGSKDADTRDLLAQARADKGEARLSRRVGLTRAKLEATREAIPSVPDDPQLGRSVFARFQPSARPVLASMVETTHRHGDRVVLTSPALTWNRGDRVHLRGSNGAGKTTLLTALLDRLHVPRDRVLIVGQDLAPAAIRAAMTRLDRMPPDERGQVLAIVAALGVAPAQLLATEHPSPGEARKLIMAMGLAEQVWGIVLDEPTNHLDLPSIDRLQTALSNYPGALLLVTHDDALAAATTSTTWAIADGQMRVL